MLELVRDDGKALADAELFEKCAWGVYVDIIRGLLLLREKDDDPGFTDGGQR